MTCYPDSPAYPMDAASRIGGATGLTKRELFAAMAMQGILAGDTEGGVPADKVAKYAADQADALIAELAEPKPQKGGADR